MIYCALLILAILRRACNSDEQKDDQSERSFVDKTTGNAVYLEYRLANEISFQINDKDVN